MMKCKKVNIRKVLMFSVLIVAFVSVSVECASAGGIPLFTYTGDVLPSADGWNIVNYPAYESTGTQIDDGVLHITDFSSDSGTCIHYRREWPVSPDYVNVAEFDLKAVLCSGLSGMVIGTNVGDYNMYYTIYPNRLQSYYRDYDRIQHLGEVYNFDTTTQYNTYKAIIDNRIAKLYINGELVLNQPAGLGHWSPYGLNVVEFGAASSPAIAEAYFDEVRAYTTTPETIISISTDKYTPTEEDLEFLDWSSDTLDSMGIYNDLLYAALDRSDDDDIELYSELLYDFLQEKLSEIDQFAVSSELQPLKDEFELHLQDWKTAMYYMERGDLRIANIFLENAVKHLENFNDMASELTLEMEESTPEVTPSPTPEETPTPVATPEPIVTPTPTPAPQAEEDSDGDGVPDDYDYAPKDPNVQSQADVKTPGFGAIFAITSFLAIAVGLRRKR